MANVKKFLSMDSVVFSYKENSMRGQIVEGVGGSVSGLALPAVVDATQVGELLPGDPVSIVATSTGTGHYKKATDNTKIVGFVALDTKKTSYKAGDVFTLASTGKVMQMVASTALSAGQGVYCDLTTDAANIVVTAASQGNGKMVGVAEEAIAAPGNDGALVAIRISVPFVPDMV